MSKIYLTQQQLLIAEQLYKEFYAQYPKEVRPWDIDTFNKACFLMLKGFEQWHLMRLAHEAGCSFAI